MSGTLNDDETHGPGGAYSNKSRDHVQKSHTIITAELGDEPSDASSPILASLINVVRRIDHHSPVRPYSSSDSPAPVNTCAPVYRRLIPDEAVSRIEAIITNKGDTRLTDCLPGDAAQTFIDSIQEVHCRVPLLLKPGLIQLPLPSSVPSPSIFH